MKIASITTILISLALPTVGHSNLVECFHFTSSGALDFAITTSHAQCIAIHDSEESGEKFLWIASTPVSPSYLIADPAGDVVPINHPDNHDDLSCWVGSRPVNPPGGGMP